MYNTKGRVKVINLDINNNTTYLIKLILKLKINSTKRDLIDK